MKNLSAPTQQREMFERLHCGGNVMPENSFDRLGTQAVDNLAPHYPELNEPRQAAQLLSTVRAKFNRIGSPQVDYEGICRALEIEVERTRAPSAATVMKRPRLR